MENKKIRLIARLDVKDVNLVKGIQLEGLRKLGDPNRFAKRYYEEGIDELLYIDIVASLYNRNNLSDIVRRTSQCMVLSIQAKKSRTQAGCWEAYYDNGRQHSGYDVVEWAKRGEALGAGEILLMSVDCEGLQRGMDLALIEAVTHAVKIPVICGGGVGCAEDIVDAANAGADAVACAAVLHYEKAIVQELKAEVRAAGVEVRL